MKILLKDNLRTKRKERNMTQEELAEVLNVSVGVISKWEKGLSCPDLETLIEIANFFEISVDVLLGYDIQCKSKEKLCEEIKKHILSKERSTPFDSVEKGIKNYPNDFEVIYLSAELYGVKGTEAKCKKQLKRAIELFERAITLLPEKKAGSLGENDIYRRMAMLLKEAGEEKKAVSILCEQNPCGVNEPLIGEILGTAGEPAEAYKHLSIAVMNNISDQFCIATGYMNAYEKDRRFSDIIKITSWIESSLSLFNADKNRSSYLDKILSGYIVAKAFAEFKLGMLDKAKISLERAKALANKFDACPCYGLENIAFITASPATAYDSYGETAIIGLENMISEQRSEEFSKLWEAVK